MRKASADVKCGAEDYRLIFMCHFSWFVCLGPFFPNRVNVPNTLKYIHLFTGISFRLNKANWMSKLNNVNYFFLYPWPWFGTLGPQLFLIAKIGVLMFLLAFSRWRIHQTLMKVWRFRKSSNNSLFCIKLKINVNWTLYLPVKSLILIISQAS